MNEPRTHEELVDAEACVDGDDAAAVVLHPPQHRGPRRVLRQQLRALERATKQLHREPEGEVATANRQT